MLSFKYFSIWLARIFSYIAGAALMAIMLLTCVDVFLRLFRRPIPGTYELISFLGAIVASFAMPYTTVERGHVAVSLIVKLFPKNVQNLIESIVSMLGIILFGLISWQSLMYGLNSQKAGEVSMTLRLPFYPIIHGVALSAAAVCFVLLTNFLDTLLKLKKR